MNENQLRKQMEAAIDIFKQDIVSIRTGRATPALIEDISVSVYDGNQVLTLKELGSIGIPEPRTITFQPWDKSLIKEIKNGIVASNKGFNPNVSGEVIRINLPAITQEQREDYIKLLRRKAEAAKVMIRDIRADERSTLQDQKQTSEISEDDFHAQEELLQKITDEFTKNIEQVSEDKEKEIRSI